MSLSPPYRTPPSRHARRSRSPTSSYARERTPGETPYSGPRTEPSGPRQTPSPETDASRTPTTSARQARRSSAATRSTSACGPHLLLPGRSKAVCRSRSVGSYFDPAQELIKVEGERDKCVDFGRLLLLKNEQLRHRHYLKVQRLQRELRVCEGDKDLCRREADQLRAKLRQAQQEQRRQHADWLYVQEELSEKEQENGALRSQLLEVLAHRGQLRAPRASPRSPSRSPSPVPAMRPRGFSHTPKREDSPSVSSRSARRWPALCTTAAVQTSPQEPQAGARGFLSAHAAVAPAEPPAVAPSPTAAEPPAAAPSPEMQTPSASASVERIPRGAPDGETDCGAGTPSPPPPASAPSPAAVSGDASPPFRRAPLAATPPTCSSGSSSRSRSLSFTGPTLADELRRAAIRDALITEERAARAVLVGEEQAEGDGMWRREHDERGRVERALQDRELARAARAEIWATSISNLERQSGYGRERVELEEGTAWELLLDTFADTGPSPARPRRGASLPSRQGSRSRSRSRPRDRAGAAQRGGQAGGPGAETRRRPTPGRSATCNHPRPATAGRQRVASATPPAGAPRAGAAAARPTPRRSTTPTHGATRRVQPNGPAAAAAAGAPRRKPPGQRCRSTPPASAAQRARGWHQQHQQQPQQHEAAPAAALDNPAPAASVQRKAATQCHAPPEPPAAQQNPRQPPTQPEAVQRKRSVSPRVTISTLGPPPHAATQSPQRLKAATQQQGYYAAHQPGQRRGLGELRANTMHVSHTYGAKLGRAEGGWDHAPLSRVADTRAQPWCKLRELVLHASHLTGRRIMQIDETRDKEKTFKQAHQKLKRIVLDVVGADRELPTGSAWRVTPSEAGRLHEHHRAAVQLALLEIVIAFDMMRTVHRDSMVTVQEVVASTDSLILLARWACQQRDPMYQSIGQSTPSRSVSRPRSVSPRPQTVSCPRSAVSPLPSPAPTMRSVARSVSVGIDREGRSPQPRVAPRASPFPAGLR
eukprot:TRINITY_DN4371_c0_g2_i1.p1 TRINITY_DN4371_c0_g2~~TRINITY_DN4371_c0_g2_i1.p1  ORF type:complete len:1022 (+),score=237.96 TRINITY_DN4371_c0_g2_i1:88-3066(+)